MTLNHSNTTQTHVCVLSIGNSETSAIYHRAGKLVCTSISLCELTFKERQGSSSNLVRLFNQWWSRCVFIRKGPIFSRVLYAMWKRSNLLCLLACFWFPACFNHLSRTQETNNETRWQFWGEKWSHLNNFQICLNGRPVVLLLAFFSRMEKNLLEY